MAKSVPTSGYDLTGKAAVVTGSSSGLGRAMALELAKRGADILIHTRQNIDGANETASQICSLGRECHVAVLDLADDNNHELLINEAWNWKNIDIWINNAGADVLTGEAAPWSFEKKLDNLWQVDVVATVRLSRLAGQRMIERMTADDAGVILNMGWDQADRGMAGDSGEMFSTIKGAVMAFTKSLAQSLAPKVRVNCLAPGWIKTSWGEQASDDWQNRARSESLLNRWGTPEDVAKVATFLASPAASFINGQVIPINGGFKYAATTKA